MNTRDTDHGIMVDQIWKQSLNMDEPQYVVVFVGGDGNDPSVKLRVLDSIIHFVTSITNVLDTYHLYKHADGTLADLYKEQQTQSDLIMTNSQADKLIRIDQIWKYRDEQYVIIGIGSSGDPAITLTKVNHPHIPEQVVPKSMLLDSFVLYMNANGTLASPPSDLMGEIEYLRHYHYISTKGLSKILGHVRNGYPDKVMDAVVELNDALYLLKEDGIVPEEED